MSDLRLNSQQRRGAFVIVFFLSVILAKCALVEAARVHYGLVISTHLYVWFPSLVIGGLCVFLYSMGPASPFRGLFSNALAAPLIVLAWVVFIFVVLRFVPSPGLAGAIGFMVALSFLYLGKATGLMILFVIGVVWVVLGAAFSGGESVWVYSVLGAALLALAALPSGLFWWHERNAGR